MGRSQFVCASSATRQFARGKLGLDIRPQRVIRASAMRNAILTLGLIFIFACRASGGSDTRPDSSSNGDGNSGGDGALATTVKEMRMNQPTNSAMVSLSNVVVVSHVASSKSGSLWVQDQGGGQYSG